MPPEIRNSSQKVAVIIGAGPAGLTAAYELLKKTDVLPIVLERDPIYVGGISKTVNYKGNRIDIGGHRFFSKSDTVMDWWLSMMPLEADGDFSIAYQSQSKNISIPATSSEKDDVMLIRNRVSRIYYNKNFFPYPIELSFDTLRKLGTIKVIKIGVTYIYRIFFPRRHVKTLEAFFINRFGDELYKTFFKSYTEKVWGIPCSLISADWGAQRVKELSVGKAIMNVLLKPFRSKDFKQKNTETSLIERFLYPKYGPGHLWEVVARRITEKGGAIKMGMSVEKVVLDEDRVISVVAKDTNGQTMEIVADFVFSTMPIKDLFNAIGDVSKEVFHVATSLEYRDFITVGLLIERAHLTGSFGNSDDTWIYIHEPNVLVGRIQIFNNWSPFLVNDKKFIWCGLEYFCSEGDELWNKTDDELKALAIQELESIGFANSENVKDGMVLREKKTYPTYAGAYSKFDKVQRYLDSITNLFPIGRNGMHRYNNQDHSMLTAMASVDIIANGGQDKSHIWDINAEQEYHEKK